MVNKPRPDQCLSLRELVSKARTGKWPRDQELASEALHAKRTAVRLGENSVIYATWR